MKHSIYNSLIELPRKRYLLYNAFTDMYLVLSQKLHEVLEQQSDDYIQERFPKFYEQLLTTGCFIEDSVNEVTLLSNRIHQMDHSDSTYQLCINPTINCNFKCWYCYEEHIPKSKMQPDTLERVKKHITSIIEGQNIERFDLSFFGGEPLLYFKEVVHPVMQHCNTVCADKGIATTISFTSNGYLINDDMLLILKDNKVDYFQITLDGNKEQHNKVRYPFVGGDSYDKIVTNIKRLIGIGVKVLLRINYTKENLLDVKHIAEDLKDLSTDNKSNLSVNFQRVWQDETQDNTIPEEWLDSCMDVFYNLGIVVTHRCMDQVTSSCYADKVNQALINYNGDVFKCTARDFKHESCLGRLDEAGQIIWDKSQMERRANLRFKKEICHQCRVAPLCGGGCSQRIMENKNNETCIYGYNDEGIDSVVLDRFYNRVVRK